MDTALSLAEIRAQCKVPLATKPVEISRLRAPKTFNFVRSLKCLYAVKLRERHEPEGKRRCLAVEAEKVDGASPPPNGLFRGISESAE